MPGATLQPLLSLLCIGWLYCFAAQQTVALYYDWYIFTIMSRLPLRLFNILTAPRQQSSARRTSIVMGSPPVFVVAYYLCPPSALTLVVFRIFSVPKTKIVVTWRTCLLLLTCLSHAFQLISASLLQNIWVSDEGMAIAHLSFIAMFSLQIVGCVNNRSQAFVASRVISLVFEGCTLIMCPWAATFSHNTLNVLNLGLVGVRALILGAMTATDLATDLASKVTSDEERPLLSETQPTPTKAGTSIDYYRGVMMLLSYVWPEDRRIQAYAAGSVAITLISNLVTLNIPLQTGAIIDKLDHHEDAKYAIGIYALLQIAVPLLSLVRTRLWFPVESYSSTTLSKSGFSHVMHLCASFHDSKNVSDIQHSIDCGWRSFGFIERLLFTLIPGLLDFAIALIFLSSKFGPYEGFVILCTALSFLLIPGYVDTSATFRNWVGALTTVEKVRREALGAWRVVIESGKTDEEIKTHNEAVNKRQDYQGEFTFQNGVTSILNKFLMVSGFTISQFLVIKSGRATPSRFVMLLAYWVQLTGSLEGLIKLGLDARMDFIRCESILGILKTKPSVESPKDAEPLRCSRGEIRFHSVDFRYAGQDQVLNNLDLHIRPGETVGIVGPTGAGKSTILDLLMRYYDPKNGYITIDGQDIRKVSLESLRQCFGVVSQSLKLFDTTILKNVKYTSKGASDEDAEQACRAAGLFDDISTFKDGINTEVGENGSKISGGQRQRIAIARALMKKPAIYLLDEATSAVDSVTEEKIQNSLSKASQGKTTIIIAHRLSTIVNADQIVVLSKGKIVEKGTHDELLDANGEYARQWRAHLRDVPETCG